MLLKHFSGVDGKSVLVMRAVFGVFVLLLMINALIVDLYLFSPKKEKEQLVESKSSVILAQGTEVCPESCVTKISDAVNTLKAQQSIVSQPSQSQQSTTLRDYFVNFGTGSGSSSDWSDVLGAAAYLDSTQYSTNATFYFETAVTVPYANQLVWVQLYDVTASHPVWNSEVSTTAGTSGLLVSNPIQLDSGRNLYQVQLKTQLNGVTNILQSRIHVIVN